MRRGTPWGCPFFVGDFFLYPGTGADAWVRGRGQAAASTIQNQMQKIVI